MIRIKMMPEAEDVKVITSKGKTNESKGTKNSHYAKDAPTRTDKKVGADDYEEAPTKEVIGRVEQDAVLYRWPEEGPFKCSNCTHWIEPDACDIVMDDIDPEGLCHLFDSKGLHEDSDSDSDDDDSEDEDEDEDSDEDKDDDDSDFDDDDNKSKSKKK